MNDDYCEKFSSISASLSLLSRSLGTQYQWPPYCPEEKKYFHRFLRTLLSVTSLITNLVEA